VRYVIIGAGAVGGTIGGRLYQHGHDVTLIARGAHFAAIREHGLTLATPDGTEVLPIPVRADPDGLLLEPDTVLVLAVKSQDSMAALDTWAEVPVRGGGVAGDRLPVLTAQNGVANERFALRLFQRVYAVCVRLPATYLDAGVVAAEGAPYSGMLNLGRYPADQRDPAGRDERAERIAADLSGSQLRSRPQPDVLRWKYGKLLSNLGNGLNALFGRGSHDELYAQVRAEGEAVLARARIEYASQAEEVAERGDLLNPQPVQGRTRGGSSTWQSLARGTGSAEVDYLNGEIVLLGREHGVPTPVNAALQRAVRQAARAGIAPGGFSIAEFQADLSAAATVH
jgi:2-dehydropantoate 2-reductase